MAFAVSVLVLLDGVGCEVVLQLAHLVTTVSSGQLRVGLAVTEEMSVHNHYMMILCGLTSRSDSHSMAVVVPWPPRSSDQVDRNSKNHCNKPAHGT